MAIFDYKCTSCDYKSENIRSKGESILIIFCPKCNKQQYFNKQISAPLGFILKGDGFYAPSKGD